MGGSGTDGAGIPRATLDIKSGFIPLFVAMDTSEIIRRAGGASKVAKTIGRHHSSVLGWTRVPAEHVRAVAALSGIPAYEIRPDIFDAPPPASEAAA